MKAGRELDALIAEKVMEWTEDEINEHVVGYSIFDEMALDKVYPVQNIVMKCNFYRKISIQKFEV